MGKEKPGFLTPKAIANRIKAKGLQKLRWYCQMCQKQCRDENGFKCHTMSESHQRQLLLFADNSHKFMDEFSSEFNREYITTLKRRFGTKRVHANIVYQEYINDRNHIHMNATKWLTLTDYVQYLGRQGICVVDETEKGWFVTYIDRDPETLRRQQEIENKKKLDLDDRQRQQMFLEKQMERAKETDVKMAAPTELIRDESDTLKINFFKTKSNAKNDTEDSSSDIPKTSYYNMSDESRILKTNDLDKSEKTSFKTPGTPPISTKSISKLPLNKSSRNEEEPSPTSKLSQNSLSKVSKATDEKRKLSALDEIITIEEKKREKMNRKDYWLHKNIIVKIITNKLGEKYHKKKALVTEVVDLYTGVVKILDTGAVIKLDQAHLETVLPAKGKLVLILNGAYRGEQAILEDINENDFSANLSIACGPLKGRKITGIQYEDISKLNLE